MVGESKPPSGRSETWMRQDGKDGGCSATRSLPSDGVFQHSIRFVLFFLMFGLLTCYSCVNITPTLEARNRGFCVCAAAVAGGALHATTSSPEHRSSQQVVSARSALLQLSRRAASAGAGARLRLFLCRATVKLRESRLAQSESKLALATLGFHGRGAAANSPLRRKRWWRLTSAVALC